MSAPGRKRYQGASRRLLLAFDIGTTFSGISYSIQDPGCIPEVRTVTRFPSQEHVGGDSKVPTVIFYDSDGNIRAIGAETLKDGIKDDVGEQGWIKARWFKLHLRPQPPRSSLLAQPKSEDSLPPLPPNKTVLQLFRDFMKCLYDCAKAHISQTHGALVWSSVASSIMFVLSHPNGWGGPQQAQMREAAIMAGLVPATPAGRARISFVTEGEASLHFCLSSGLTLRENVRASGILIVDAGGGTIDLTAYRRLPDKLYTEISIPACFFQGAAYVTMRAERHFKDLLANTSFSADVGVLTTRFDRHTKHAFRSESEPLRIQFASHRERDAALNIRGGRLTLSGTVVASFFEPSVEGILDAILSQMAAAQVPIRTVFLVGGSSASDWLYEQVRRRVEPLGMTVERPDAHVNKAVSDGAVSFHLDNLVTSRMSRSTYGISTKVDYLSGDPEHTRRGHRVTIDDVTDTPILDGLFADILRKGVTVDTTQEFRRPFWTSASDRSQLRRYQLEILAYSGAKSHPTWIVDEPDMYPTVCTVEADTSSVYAYSCTSPTGNRYYRIDFAVVLLFGLTELSAQIAYIENGVEKRGPASIVYEGTG